MNPAEEAPAEGLRLLRKPPLRRSGCWEAPAEGLRLLRKPPLRRLRLLKKPPLRLNC